MRNILLYSFFIISILSCSSSDETNQHNAKQDALIELIPNNQNTISDNTPLLKKPKIYTKDDSMQWAREDSLQKAYKAKCIGCNNRNASTNLKFTSISAQQFIAFQKTYRNPLDTSISRVVHSSNDFKIKTADSLYSLKYQNLDEFNEYKGYLEPYKLYLTYSGSGHNEIAWMHAIDSLNNKIYCIEPAFDNGLMETRVSPNHNFILWFHNDWSGYKNSYISIVKVTQEQASYKYIDYLGYLSNSWRIAEIVWIDNNSLAIKIYDDEADGKLVNIRYVKASF